MNLPYELTLTRAAMALGVSRRQLERRVEAGSVPSYKPTGLPRGRRMVLTEDLCELSDTARENIYRFFGTESGQTDP